MSKPEISKDFTVDDIHRVREFNARERERLGSETYNRELNRRVAEFLSIEPDEIQTHAAARIINHG